MNILISIDDTDNLNSPGSGQHAAKLAKELLTNQLVCKYSGISRHQLYFNDAIAYTSHNSAMCFSAETTDNTFDQLTKYCIDFLKANSAPGSDPGLCIAPTTNLSEKTSLIEFGQKAKQEVVTKEDAYLLAHQTGVHLSEHGGTGDGVIGAVAGIGLRLSGNDGRFRGWLDFGEKDDIVHTQTLCNHPQVSDVIDTEGTPLPPNSMVRLEFDRIKTVFSQNKQVIVVNKNNSHQGKHHSSWSTLSKVEIQQY